MADVALATVAAAASPTPYVVRKEYANLTAAPALAEAITGGGQYGFTQAQANALLQNVRELRAIVVAAGLALD